VATDHTLSDTVSELAQGSPIENELPTYRAISPRAILALLCGVLALFSIASPFFYLFAVLAVVLGFSADRNIQRYPDMLTGRGLAQGGAALGLIFGLSILTVSQVQGFFRLRNAKDFARHYAEVLKTGNLAEIMWLGLPPVSRKTVTPADVMEKMKAPKGREASVYEMKTSAIRNLKKRLDSSSDQNIHFVRIEREGNEGLTAIALALFEVHGPQSKEFPDAEQYALAHLKGTSQEGKAYDWWVEDVVFPYKPASADLPEKPVDDGHGHGQ
jgi:hypothetical protein